MEEYTIEMYYTNFVYIYFVSGPTLTNATEIIHFFNVGNVQLEARNING